MCSWIFLAGAYLEPCRMFRTISTTSQSLRQESFLPLGLTQESSRLPSQSLAVHLLPNAGSVGHFPRPLLRRHTGSPPLRSDGPHRSLRPLMSPTLEDTSKRLPQPHFKS